MNFQESFLVMFGGAISIELGVAVAVTFVLAIVRVASPRLSQRIVISRKGEI